MALSGPYFDRFHCPNSWVHYISHVYSPISENVISVPLSRYMPSGDYSVTVTNSGPGAPKATFAETIYVEAPPAIFSPMLQNNLRNLVPPVDEVYIPTGFFLMGCDLENPAENACNVVEQQIHELPLHRVFLDAYYIDKYPVTNSRYLKCVDEGECTKPSSNRSTTRIWYHDNPEYALFPVIAVTRDQAREFCAWEGKRLPTEAEWEKAARGSTDTRKYPWGNEAPTCDLANFGGLDGCVGDTSEVGIYPDGASPYGVMDMAGNVWEWVNDDFDENYYAHSPEQNPGGPDEGNGAIVRGGSAFFFTNTLMEFELRTANRETRDEANLDIGFRCVRAP